MRAVPLSAAPDPSYEPCFFLDRFGLAVSHLKGIPSVTAALDDRLPAGVGLSIASVAELWEGVLYSRNPAKSQANLERFLHVVEVLEMDQATCRKFGELRGMLRKQGMRIGDFDILIAATALQLDLTLLTNNRRHFERIPGLRIESL